MVTQALGAMQDWSMRITHVIDHAAREAGSRGGGDGPAGAFPPLLLSGRSARNREERTVVWTRSR